MYVVAIFALALLSPLPFVSPFVYDVQNVEAQTPFGANDRDISPPIELSNGILLTAPPLCRPTSPQKFDSYDLTSSTDNTNRSRSIKCQPNCFSVDISYSGCYCRAFY